METWLRSPLYAGCSQATLELWPACKHIRKIRATLCITLLQILHPFSTKNIKVLFFCIQVTKMYSDFMVILVFEIILFCLQNNSLKQNNLIPQKARRCCHLEIDFKTYVTMQKDETLITNKISIRQASKNMNYINESKRAKVSKFSKNPKATFSFPSVHAAWRLLNWILF